MFIYRVLRGGAVALLGLAATTGARAESLTSAMAYAYENNPEIASSFLSVRAARQGIRSAEGALLPTIGAEGSLGATSTWTPAGQSWSTSDSIGIGYNQTLFDNNATGSAILAAEASYDAAVYGAQNAEQHVLRSVGQADVTVATTRRIVESRQESSGFVEAQVRSARDRLEPGEGTQLDVSPAEASLAQSTASYQAAVNNLRVSEA